MDDSLLDFSLFQGPFPSRTGHLVLQPLCYQDGCHGMVQENHPRLQFSRNSGCGDEATLSLAGNYIIHSHSMRTYTSGHEEAIVNRLWPKSKSFRCRPCKALRGSSQGTTSRNGYVLEPVCGHLSRKIDKKSTIDI